MLGEFLYALTAKDAQTQPVIQRRVFYSTATVAAASFNLFDTVPQDKALILQSVIVTGVGGGAQTVLDADIRIVDASATPQLILLVAKMTGTAANRRELYVADLGLLVMPNERVASLLNFSAAAIANTYEFSYSGLLIPKGNLQLR